MSYDAYPPNGLDRADGLDHRLGTPTPAAAIVNKPLDTNFEEDINSPEIERGEQGTVSHTFKCDQETGLTLITGIGRGSILEDSSGNITRVVNANYQQQKGDQCTIRIVAEGITFDSPPDEFDVDVVEFNPSLFTHPRYASIQQYIPDSGNYEGTPIGALIFSWIQAAANLPQQVTIVENEGMINSTNIPDPDVLELALELLDKTRQGEETFYLAGFKVTWSQYYFIPVDLNPGGYIEDPVLSGTLPWFFYSDNGTPGGNDIFLNLASQVAPAFYENGLSWLRLADTIRYQRTWFKITATWLAGPYGHWDAQIYSPTFAPLA